MFFARIDSRWVLGAALLALLMTAGRAQAKPPPKKAPAPKAQKAPSPPREEPEKASEKPAAADTTAPHGPTRIDFDDRMIQGQSNKSGAVYLFDRKELSTRSMVSKRSNFRDQIHKDVLAE